LLGKEKFHQGSKELEVKNVWIINEFDESAAD
jgi:hypothetical protein